MQIFKTIIQKLDIIILPTIFLVATSTLLFKTLANSSGTYSFLPQIAEKQPILIIISILIFIAVLVIPTNLIKTSTVILGLQLSTIFMLGTLFLAPTYANTHRWFTIGRFTLQPSEFFKITSLLNTVLWLHTKKHSLLILNLIGIALIFLEPDLGMTLIILGTNLLLTLLWYAWHKPSLRTALLQYSLFLITIGISFTINKLLLVPGLLMLLAVILKFRQGIKWLVLILMVNLFIPIALVALYNSPLLQEYQKKRIAPIIEAIYQRNLDGMINGVFINFHTRQARIAIGSGGLFGKGIENTTQSRLRFLPEVHTDFIYATISEIYGLIGALTIIFTYLLIIGRLLYISYNMIVFDTFAAYVTLGVSLYFILEILLGIGVNLAILPTKGAPLPFLSYGGSSLFAHSIMIGLVLNLYYNTVKSPRHKIAHTLV